MRTVIGAGCWPGRAEGPVVWLKPANTWPRDQVSDRPAEILRFRAEVSRALQDLEAWSERQQTLEARVVLQSYKEALLENAWHQRACALIDAVGLPSGTAAVEAAAHVSGVISRSPELQPLAACLITGAQWLAGRLQPSPPLPPDVIVAAEDLSPMEILDLQHPAVIVGGEPAILGKGPLVWGVPGLGPEWAGSHAVIDGAELTLDLPEPTWWLLRDNCLRGIPVCHLNGDPEAVARMASYLGRLPAVLVRRLDDLAAIPLIAPFAAAVAVDLGRLGRLVCLKHPGVEHLLKAAAQVGLPLLAGGRPATSDPDRWLGIGFTGFYGEQPPLGGTQAHAIRRSKESGL